MVSCIIINSNEHSEDSYIGPDDFFVCFFFQEKVLKY